MSAKAKNESIEQEVDLEEQDGEFLREAMSILDPGWSLIGNIRPPLLDELVSPDDPKPGV
jgi:hypothetical protein